MSPNLNFCKNKCKKALLFFALVLSLITNVSAKDKLTVDGDRLAVELDVVFNYKPDEANLERWKQVFDSASVILWDATKGHIFVKKVNLFVCPETEKKTSFRPNVDIVIYDGPGRNLTRGRLHDTIPMDLYNRGRSIAEDGESVGHELCHYLFGIRDEYAQVGVAELQTTYPLKTRPDVVSAMTKLFEEQQKEGVVRSQTTQEEQALINEHGRTKFDYRIFCSDFFFKRPDTCIMDGANTTDGNDYYRGLCSAEDHSTGTFTTDSQSRSVVWTRNPQSFKKGESCRTTAEKILKDVWGFEVDLSKQVTGLPPKITFNEKNDCSEVVVLLLDKSGSMSGLPLLNLKTSVYALIDILSNDVSLGIVWFDSQPQAAVGIQKLENNRELAKLAVAPISASGGTRIGFGLGVAYQQIIQLRDPDKPRAEETIYLVTDGVSSDDTTDVVNIIESDGVKINPIALGDDVDTFGLFEMADRTGGRLFVARENEDITKVVVQGTAESLENFFVLSDRLEAPLNTSIPVEVDAYVGRVLVQLNLTGINPGAIQQEQFAFRTENGSSTPVVVRFEVLGPDSASVVVEVENPSAGTNILELPAGLLTASSESNVLVLGQSVELLWVASTASGSKVNEYPNPVVIQASVHSVLGSAHGMEVTATIERPDGSEVVISLYDDGSQFHGDEIANDGFYSAKFLQYNGDGTYQVRVVGRADENTTAGAGPHTIPSVDTRTFLPFRREASFSFDVTGFQQPESSTLVLEALSEAIPDQEIETSLTATTGVAIGGFKLLVGPGQGVRIKEMTLQLAGESEDLQSFKRFALYIDEDRDGFVDFFGPTSEPKAIIDASVDESGLVTLQDVLELEGDTEAHILLVGFFEQEEEPVLLEGGVPILALPLILLSLLYKDRRRAFLVVALCFIGVAVSGCSNDDGFIFTNSQQTQEVLAEAPPREFQASFSLGQITAVGRIDGEPVELQIKGEPSVVGPVVNIR